MKQAIRVMIGVAGLILSGCTTTFKPSANVSDQPPVAPREFRAAWVATVDNIDWPSKPGLSTAQQQAEVIKILDTARSLNLNAIVLQVRTSCDALYDSKIEPWSEYLTGLQGKPPEPFYDPLQFWVEESHKRGLELHAWLNPYRARAPAADHPDADSHVSKRNPSIVRSYGKYLWLDPSEPEAAKQSLDVFKDIVKRYDVDGVHMDDYFYPYPIKAEATGASAVAAALDGPATKSTTAATSASTSSSAPATAQATTKPEEVEIDFPDSKNWEKYVGSGGKLSKADWRRDHIDRFVETLYAEVKKEKPWVKVGLAPFGIGKPALRPKEIKGFSQYDKLYADADLWLEKGWCDYFTPQQYWAIAKEGQQFPILTDYWISQNKMKRHLWPGMYTGRADKVVQPKGTWPISEVKEQIAVLRARGTGANGHVHFSMKSIMDERTKLFEELKRDVYQDAALIPASPWLGNNNLETPVIKAKSARQGAPGIEFEIVSPGVGQVALHAVWLRVDGKWVLTTVDGSKSKFFVAGPADAVAVSAIDRFGNESARVVLVK